jgi:hypothetical protein
LEGGPPKGCVLPNGSRLSCGALKKKSSFHYPTRAASFKRLLGCTFENINELQRPQDNERPLLITEPHAHTVTLNTSTGVAGLALIAERPLFPQHLHHVSLNIVKDPPCGTLNELRDGAPVLFCHKYCVIRTAADRTAEIELDASALRTNPKAARNHAIETLGYGGSKPVG